MPQARTYGYAVGASHFARAGCYAVALCAGALGAAAQGTTGPQEAAAAVRLINAEQGREIAAAALGQEEPVRGTQDCSHLVHQIYAVAGYEYPYASSFELYAGHGDFRRVRHAQAGDLVAWPGHVGIVLNPRQHTFYSLVRSGLQAEDYLGPYWRSRGRPRFYRFVAEAGTFVRTATAARPRSGSSAHAERAAVLEERAEAEKPARRGAQEASERTPMTAAPTEPTGQDATAPIPSTMAISAQGARPSVEEVAEAISELSNAATGVLRTDEPMKVGTPVVIFDELKVERVEIKRDKGWAHLQISSRMRIGSDGADFKRRREKVRLELRRGESGWVAVAPVERTFVARDVAVRVLAAQLAELAQSDGAAKHEDAIVGQEARIANLISALLEK